MKLVESIIITIFVTVGTIGLLCRLFILIEELVSSRILRYRVQHFQDSYVNLQEVCSIKNDQPKIETELPTYEEALKM